MESKPDNSGDEEDSTNAKILSPDHDFTGRGRAAAQTFNCTRHR